MSTIRVQRRSRFTTIDRETINDDRLSFRARGLLVWLLDKPDDWRCDSDSLAMAASEGRDAIRTALRELAECGYIRRTKTQTSRGQWITETMVFERPPVDTDDGFPGVGNPDVGNPDVGEPGPLLKTETEDCDRRETSSLSESSTEVAVVEEPKTLTADFDMFYGVYPRKVGRPAAAKAYKLAQQKHGTIAILGGLARWSEYWVAKNEPQFVPHPSTWLNQERYLDEPPPLPRPKAAGLNALANVMNRRQGQ